VNFSRSIFYGGDNKTKKKTEDSAVALESSVAL